MDKIEEFLLTINEKLKKMNITFLFSGALAANVYRTIPRATMDIDIAIPFDEDIIIKIKNNFDDYEIEDWELVKQRLEVKKKDPNVIVPEFLRLKHKSGFLLDFFPLFENHLIRKKSAKIANTEIEIIGPEDLLILKSIYYRYKDRDDLENILGNPKIKLDINYLIKELDEYQKDEIIKLIKKLRPAK